VALFFRTDDIKTPIIKRITQHLFIKIHHELHISAVIKLTAGCVEILHEQTLRLLRLQWHILVLGPWLLLSTYSTAAIFGP
jgi:hypothetical protein